MKRALDAVNAVITVLAALFLAGMTILVLLQVLYRYVLEIPFPESQELAIYAMVYVVMLGSTIAVRRKTHIAVGFVVEQLPETFAKIVRLIAYAALLLFFYLLLTEGWTLMLRSMRQRSPTTGIPVGYIVASIPFASGVSLLYVLEQMFNDFFGNNNKPTKA